MGKKKIAYILKWSRWHSNRLNVIPRNRRSEVVRIHLYDEQHPPNVTCSSNGTIYVTRFGYKADLRIREDDWT